MVLRSNIKCESEHTFTISTFNSVETETEFRTAKLNRGMRYRLGSEEFVLNFSGWPSCSNPCFSPNSLNERSQLKCWRKYINEVPTFHNFHTLSLIFIMLKASHWHRQKYVTPVTFSVHCEETKLAPVTLF
jgi:hypothetical protein